MDDRDTTNRRARLRELIRECFSNSHAELLRHIQRRTGKLPNQGEMSALARSDSGKSFGDKKAKTLAAQIGLSRYWFDAPIGTNIAMETWGAPLSLSSNMQTHEPPAQCPSISQGHSEGDMRATASITKLVPKDCIVIEQYAASGAMGHGLTLPDQPGIIHSWQVSTEWLEKNVRGHTSLGNLCIVTGFGESMRPMFNPGDPLLIDRGVKCVDSDGIYFFRIGHDGFIKRLQRIPTARGMTYKARSANKEYDDFPITDDMDFEVLGRVLRVWHSTEF